MLGTYFQMIQENKGLHNVLKVFKFEIVKKKKKKNSKDEENTPTEFYQKIEFFLKKNQMAILELKINLSRLIDRLSKR